MGLRWKKKKRVTACGGHKHHISLLNVLITHYYPASLWVGWILFTSLEERLEKITTNTWDLIEKAWALFMGNCEKQYTPLWKPVYHLNSPQGETFVWFPSSPPPFDYLSPAPPPPPPTLSYLLIPHALSLSGKWNCTLRIMTAAMDCV